jgi:hypothetical protein
MEEAKVKKILTAEVFDRISSASNRATGEAESKVGSRLSYDARWS